MQGGFKKSRLVLACLLVLAAVVLWSGAWVNSWILFSEEPRRADIAVCLNSSDARVDKVIELYRQGYVGRVLVTYPSTRQKALQDGMLPEDLVNLNGGFASTFEEARHVIEFLKTQRVGSAIIVSDPLHMYRAWWTYEHVNQGSGISLTYVASRIPGPGKWWKTARGRFLVLNEVPKVIYYWLAHGLLGMERDPDWVSGLEKWYADLLKDGLGLTAGA